MAIASTTAIARPRAVPAVQGAARLAYLDNLRVALAALVVAHHVGQAYGPTGGAWPIFNPTRAAILGPFFGVNASFFMGLFFLISGYCLPRAYDQKGARGFLTDRALRLGVPLLVVSLGVLLPLRYALDGHGQPFLSFLAGYLRQPEVAHLWFVGHLLIYAVGYTLWRTFRGRATRATTQPGAAPGHRALLAYTLALAVVAFLVRIVFPIDRWVDLAPFVRAEVAHLPQYLSLFVLGVVAYQRDWLRQLPTGTGMTWLKIGLGASAAPYATTALRELTPLHIDLWAGGGWSLHAFVWSVLEACICVGLCVGLLTLFRERAKGQGALLRALAAGSYAVYIIHVFPVVGLQAALAESPMPPLAKFGLVTLLAVPLCFALAAALRKLPLLRRIV